MTGLELPLALFLLANLAAVLVRTMRSATAAERMLAALLFGSTGVGILALLAFAGGGTPLIDAALTLVLLAAITGVAFARRGWTRERGEGPDA